MTEATELRWGAWFGDRNLRVRLPAGWQVTMHRPSGGADLGEAGFRTALANPIESAPLRDLARGRKDAVIVVDDLSRPTPAERLLPLIVEELVAGGIPTERIRIIMGVAAHHPMLRDDIIRKLGRKIADSFPVSNHNVFEGNEYVGETSAGTPVHINRDFLRADLKLCVGSILPHGGPGFGGGAKLVLPGVAGIETIYQNHRPDNLKERGVDRLEGNVQRADMEEAAGMAGLDFIVNTVVNPQREVVGLFCGHYVAAHRAGCEVARTVYRTPVPEEVDVAILSCYPKDSECYQFPNALNVLRSSPKPVLRRGGTMVVASAASQGMGEHFLHGPGFRLPPAGTGEGARPAPTPIPGTTRLLFSANVTPWDVQRWGGDPDSLYRAWPELVRRLRDQHGSHARCAVFPCAAMQLGAAQEDR